MPAFGTFTFGAAVFGASMAVSGEITADGYFDPVLSYGTPVVYADNDQRSTLIPIISAKRAAQTPALPDDPGQKLRMTPLQQGSGNDTLITRARNSNGAPVPIQGTLSGLQTLHRGTVTAVNVSVVDAATGTLSLTIPTDVSGLIRAVVSDVSGGRSRVVLDVELVVDDV